MHWQKTIRYRFGAIDDAGIAYYPGFFHVFHCAFEDWWQDALGVRYAGLMHERKIGFPTVHVETNFKAPVFYGNEPVVHVGVQRVGTKSVTFGFWLTGPGVPTTGDRAPADTPPEQLLCTSATTTACVCMDTMKPLPVPDDLRALFADYTLEDKEFGSF